MMRLCAAVEHHYDWSFGFIRFFGDFIKDSSALRIGSNLKGSPSFSKSMETWLKISLLLCMFGFFKELRPSEPFVTPYLLSPYKNFTNAEVSQLIYPFGTYSYLGLLIVVFLLTDILRYKSVIIFDAICGLITWSLLLWGPGIPLAQLLEFFYGAFLAGEVAYYSYAYARIEDRDLYARLTSHTRSACLFGRCASGVVGQTLYSTDTLSLWDLNLITLAFIGIALIFGLCLPPVKHSIYFHQKKREEVAAYSVGENGDVRDSSNENACEGKRKSNGGEDSYPENSVSLPDGQSIKGETSIEKQVIFSVSSVQPPPTRPNEKKEKSNIILAFQLIWKHAYNSYSDLWVIRWSIWWAITTAGFLQVLSYIQILWQQIEDEKEAKGEKVSIYNGAIEAAQTVLGALATLGCGWLRLNWKFIGEFSLAAVAVIQGLIMILSAVTKELWVAYLCYIIFGILYQAMVTVASMEVAKKIEDDCYGLIFGLNTFLALLIQTVWVIVAVTDVGLALGARDQFLVTGGYFIILGMVFLIIALITTTRMGFCVFFKQPLWLPKRLESNTMN